MATSENAPANIRQIFIVDDHPMLREGLAQLIGRESDLRVCGEAEDAETALAAIEKLHPDLALVDITLAGRNGLELIKDIQAINPQQLILVISMHDESLFAERVLRAGARGYIMKQQGGKQMMKAIRTILEGNTYVSEKVAARIIDIFTGRRSTAESSSVERLTDRELEVFQLIAQALSTKEIAQRLRISTKTVEVHKSRIREKLALKSGAELISYAARWAAAQPQ